MKRPNFKPKIAAIVFACLAATTIFASCEHADESVPAALSSLSNFRSQTSAERARHRR